VNKGLIAVVVLFLGFWLLNDAAGFADTTESVASWGWDLTQQVFNGIIDFFDAL
jgi:hypothetical protein